MNMINDILEPARTTTVETEDSGLYEVSVRPRRTGPLLVPTSMVRFRRPERRESSGFGVQLRALRLIAQSRQEPDPIIESTFQLGPKAAQSVLDWIDTLERDGKK